MRLFYSFHSFRVDSDIAHVLNFYTPGGFEQTTIDLGQPAPTRTLPPPGISKKASPKQIKVLFEKVGMHIVDAPDTLRL